MSTTVKAFFKDLSIFFLINPFHKVFTTTSKRTLQLLPPHENALCVSFASAVQENLAACGGDLAQISESYKTFGLHKNGSNWTFCDARLRKLSDWLAKAVGWLGEWVGVSVREA